MASLLINWGGFSTPYFFAATTIFLGFGMLWLLLPSDFGSDDIENSPERAEKQLGYSSLLRVSYFIQGMVTLVIDGASITYT